MTDTLAPGLVRIPPQPASPTELRDVLRSLWRSACADGNDVARAVTINFVAVARGDADDLRSVANRLMSRSPARAFLVTIDDTRQEPAIEVSAVMRCGGNSRDVIAEEIRIVTPEKWFSHVPGLVRPLVIHDLPTHFYWADDWRNGAEFAALRKLSDHCIVDSRRFTLPAVQLVQLAESNDAKGPLRDLSWLRLRPWRRALAEAFQRVEWRDGLVVTGVVRHGRDATAAAILLAQWLEQKLGGRITLEDGQDGTGPCPEAVTLRFEGHEIEVTATENCLSAQVSTPAQCFLPFRLPCSNGHAGDLIAAAIDIA